MSTHGGMFYMAASTEQDEQVLQIAMSLSRNEWARLKWSHNYCSISQSLIDMGLVTLMWGVQYRTPLGDKVLTWIDVFFEG